MLKLIFENGEWKGFEAPEKPEHPSFRNDENAAKAWRYVLKQYHEAYAEARANALKVLNPEVIQEGEHFPYDIYKIVNGIADDGEYDWPGTFEYSASYYNFDDEGYIILSLPSKETKEETQDELWIEVVDIVITAIDINICEELKAKYVLTRR